MGGILSMLIPGSRRKNKIKGASNSLFGRRARDGSSPEKAVVVDSIAEEYMWITCYCSDFTMEQQALHHIDDKPYDVLTLGNGTGEKRTVYFDISSFFGTFSEVPDDAAMEEMMRKAAKKFGM